jgi:hypothetical protein
LSGSSYAFKENVWSVLWMFQKTTRKVPGRRFSSNSLFYLPSLGSLPWQGRYVLSLWSINLENCLVHPECYILCKEKLTREEKDAHMSNVIFCVEMQPNLFLMKTFWPFSLQECMEVHKCELSNVDHVASIPFPGSFPNLVREHHRQLRNALKKHSYKKLSMSQRKRLKCSKLTMKMALFSAHTASNGMLTFSPKNQHSRTKIECEHVTTFVIVNLHRPQTI